MSNNTAEIVVQSILKILEQGPAKWEHYLHALARPAGMHRNMRGTGYRGINRLILSFRAADLGTKCATWATYNQVKAAGGFVNKGEKGTPVVFWQPIIAKKKVNGVETVEKKGMVLRYYTVFNLSQTSLAWTADEVAPNQSVIASDWFEGVTVDHSSVGVASYNRMSDKVTMPLAGFFKDQANYNATLAHEVAHWTGHESRLNRKLPYATEELVAELGAAIFAAEHGVDFTPMHNTAAYLKSWLDAARQDSKFLLTVASNAQKAADLMTQHYKFAKGTGKGVSEEEAGHEENESDELLAA